MAKFEISTNPASGEINFSGSLSTHDLQKLRLDKIDRSVILAPAETISDQLQSLEIIFRRLEQQCEVINEN